MARSRTSKLRIEPLERRDMLAVVGFVRSEITVNLKPRPETADPNDRVLEIIGTDRGDSLVLRQTAGQIYLENVESSVRNLSGITLITIDGRAGNDLISLGGLGTKRPVNIPTVVRGGKGNDFIFGSTVNDQLHGDGGLDQIFGDGGDDLVDGGADPDFLSGNAGVDTFIGRTAYDQFLDRAAGETIQLSTTGLSNSPLLAQAAGEGLSQRRVTSSLRNRA